MRPFDIKPCWCAKDQLTVLTVAALKLHLKHFKLQIARNKAALVDHLYAYLQTDAANDQQANIINGAQGNATDNQPTYNSYPLSQQQNSTPVLPQQMLRRSYSNPNSLRGQALVTRIPQQLSQMMIACQLLMFLSSPLIQSHYKL